MQIINSVSVGDQYTTAATIENVLSSNGGYFLLQSADCFMQLAYNVQGQIHWTREIHVPTGSGQIYPGTAGIRFRNYVAGSVAILTAALSENKEPSISIGASGSIGASALAATRVTVLPASPTDLQIVELTDSLTVPTYFWLMMYDAGSTSPFKWECIGGTPKKSIANSTASNNADAYADWAGSSFTLPNNGDYDVMLSAVGATNVGTNAPVAGLALLVNAVNVGEAASYPGSTSTRNMTLAVAYEIIGGAPAQIVKAQTRCYGATGTQTANYANGTLAIIPRRLS